MTGVRLTQAAEADLEAIYDHTTEHFGVDQALKTDGRFQQTFQALADMPRSGRLHPQISPPGHEFRIRIVLKRFFVVYELDDGGVRVVRIVHGARNLIAELADCRGDQDDETGIGQPPA